MSHFTEVELELKDGACIESALKELGYEVETGKVKVRGYSGNRTADIVVRKEQFAKGKHCYGDVGFRLNKQTGKYEMVCDEMDLNAGKFPLNKFKQTYGVHKVRGTARRQGFRVVRERKEKNGQMRILLRR